jgi:hypothetical protein
MLGIAHLWKVIFPLFNELQEVMVRSHMVHSMCDFNESREGKLGGFSCLESLKIT